MRGDARRARSGARSPPSGVTESVPALPDDGSRLMRPTPSTPGSAESFSSNRPWYATREALSG